MLAYIKKALGAAVSAAVGGYATANADGSVSTEEWIYVTTLVIVTFVVTYFLRNKTNAPATEENEGV